MDEQDIDRRVRERAHRIWEGEGRPEGMAEAHWDLARIAVSLEDARSEMLRPVAAKKPEPIETLVNQAEFSTLTDQGESHAPGAPSGDSG